MMNLIRDVITYISKPHFYESKEKLSVKALPILGKLLGLNFILVLFVYYLTQFIFTLTHTHLPHQKVDLFDNPGPLIFFIITVIAPFIEELIFRSWLRKRWGVKYVLPLTLGFTVVVFANYFGIKLPQYVWGIWGFFS